MIAGTAKSSAEEFREACSFHQRGDLREAERRYRAILAIDRGHFDSLVHLGLACLQQGRFDEAVGLLRDALDRDPNSAEAHRNLANALLALNRLDQAVLGYENALAIDPDDAEASFGLASALHALGRHQQTITRYERAIAIDPDYAEAHYGLATALQALNRHQEAVPFYENALEIDADYAEANYGLATVLQVLNRHEEAIRFYGRTLVLTPDNGAAYHSYGVALEEIGRLQEARLAHERAVTLEPRKAEFYRCLFNAKKMTAEDQDLAALQALAQDASLPGEEQLPLHFALGKALADVGEHRRSFRHFLEGNARKRQQTVYDEAATLRVFDRIRAVFDAELMQAKRGQGDPSSVPIFILGMPRSGSTLIEQILASHPKVIGGGERMDLADALKSLEGAVGGALPVPELFRAATSGELRSLGAGYLDRLKAAAVFGTPLSWQRITDKMPANFRLVGSIYLALPNARIIHTLPRSGRYLPVLLFDPVRRGSALHLRPRRARPILSRIFRADGALAPRVAGGCRARRAQYEELVADFEQQARRIIAHCGLEWDDACLAFDKTARPVRTASLVQVRQPIYRSSVGRWRPDEATLRPLLDGLGPDLARAPAPR